VVVPGGGRLVALLGVDDLVVVDTPDALLVTTRARAQHVKNVVDAVREHGREGLL
jgi:mannose-1-phosphate guanylyltransferase